MLLLFEEVGMSGKKYQMNHVSNTKRYVQFHLLHAQQLTANASCLKTFTKQYN